VLVLKDTSIPVRHFCCHIISHIYTINSTVIDELIG
jgi:hypothetical protein